MRQHITRNIGAVDQEVAVLDPDVDMRAEYEQLLRELPHCLTSAEVTLEGRDLLVGPMREGVRPGGSDLVSLSCRQLHHTPPQVNELVADILRCVADRGTHLDDGLVQLRLHLTEHQPLVLQDLRDIRLQLPGGRVDDLVLLFNSYRETWTLHRLETDVGCGMWDVREGRSQADLIRCWVLPHPTSHIHS